MHVYAKISIQRANGWVTKCKRLGILKPPFSAFPVTLSLSKGL